MKIKALIPVRSGSERVPYKNIRPFADSTLLDIKIQTMLNVKGLDGIIVNSNSDEMLKIASKYGVETIKREDKYATSKVLMSDVYVNLAENINADIVLFTHVTSPLLKAETISKMIEKYRTIEKHDSVSSVYSLKQFLYLDGKPLNYDPLRQPRTQDLPNIYVYNSGVSIITREKMKEYRNVVGRNPYLYEVSGIEAFDIDTMFDFKVAEYLYKNEKK